MSAVSSIQQNVNNIFCLKNFFFDFDEKWGQLGYLDILCLLLGLQKCLKYLSNRPHPLINGDEKPVTLNTVLYVRNINQIQWSHHAGNQLKLLEIIQFLKAYERPSMTDTG